MCHEWLSAFLDFGAGEAEDFTCAADTPFASRLLHSSSAPAAVRRDTQADQGADSDSGQGVMQTESAAAGVDIAEKSTLRQTSSAGAELVAQDSAVKSARSRVKNYLRDQVDSAGMWERHVGAALGRRYGQADLCLSPIS